MLFVLFCESFQIHTLKITVIKTFGIFSIKLENILKKKHLEEYD